MPSPLHEILIELFRERPVLAAELLADQLGLVIPEFDKAQMSSAELNDIAPTEYRADAVVILRDGDHNVQAVVVEVQLSQDPDKLLSWPAYVATLYARLRCPVALLVLCPDRAVARWAAKQIPVGNPGFVLTPMVLGPAGVPVVMDVEVAVRSPELVVLSALAHADELGQPEQEQLLRALVAALSNIDVDHGSLYYDIVSVAMREATRKSLEAMMSVLTGRPLSEFGRRHYDEGEAHGKAEAIVTVLTARGVELSPGERSRIVGCDDQEQLDRWLRQVATVASADELFD